MQYSFKLDDAFVDQYKTKTPPFGFNGLGETIYRRTYSRVINGVREKWYQTVRRVVEGTYSIQMNHINMNQLGWNTDQGQRSAQEMYDLIFNMKFLPPGRGLYCMGTNIVHQKNLAAALNNCAFVSTETLDQDLSLPFEFLMDATMLGVGVGFDTKGAGKLTILGPDTSQPPMDYVIEDSREGWVRSVGVLLQSYFGEDGVKTPVIVFDYSHIRKPGEELKTYGGKSSGPDPLIELHKKLRETLDKQIGSKISSTTITDIFNLIGRCVIGIGNIRAAEIAFGEVGDNEFLDLKDYEKNPHRADYGWTSNNSIFAEIGMDYSKIAEHVAKSGEPGLAWLENMRHYGRMCDPRNDKDIKVKGGNPCLEQSLESYELCCLVETFPARHSSLKEFQRTLKFAYLYAKTVTLGRTHWAQTNRVMLRNRRIGCSVSGIAQFLASHSLEELRQWLDAGYQTVQHWDEVYSEWLCVPKSIKTTSVKPSGTVSLLAGATPGMHYPLGKYYIRRVRFQADSDMLPALRHAGYHIEPCVGQEKTMVVVSFPACAGDNITVQEDVSIFEQFSLAAFLQRYWADNQVSCTISFNPETESAKITKCLDFFQYQLKGVAMLPRVKLDMFPQMPYEKIDKETYEAMVKDLKPINWDIVDNEMVERRMEETAEMGESNGESLEVEEKLCNARECNFCDADQSDLNMTGQYKAD